MLLHGWEFPYLDQQRSEPKIRNIRANTICAKITVQEVALKGCINSNDYESAVPVKTAHVNEW